MREWTLIAADSSPAARGGCTLNPLGSDSLLLVGGATREAQCFGEAMMFHIPSRTWKPVANGSIPSRTSHASCHSISSGCVYIHGGHDASGMPLADLYRYTKHPEKEGLITCEKLADAPLARHSCAMVMLDDHTLWVHGGALGDGASMSDDVSVYDTRTNSWTQIALREVPQDAAREMHCAVLDAAAQRVIVYGGRSAEGVLLGDVLVYDLRAQTLSNAAMLDDARVAHAACLWSTTGSSSSSSINNDSSSSNSTSNSESHATVASIDDSTSHSSKSKDSDKTGSSSRGSSTMLVFGGFDGSMLRGDLVAIDTVSFAVRTVCKHTDTEDSSTTSSSSQAAAAAAPGGRMAAAMTMVGRQVFLFGGVDAQCDHGDLWSLHL